MLESPQTHPLQKKVPRLHYGNSMVLRNTPQYLNGTIIRHFKEQRGFQKHPIILKCYILMVIPWYFVWGTPAQTQSEHQLL